MPPKRKRGDQRAEREFLGDQVDSLFLLSGSAMPVPCARCLLLLEQGEVVECRVAPGISRCSECCRRGHAACDASGVERADCKFSLVAAVARSDFWLVARLHAALSKVNDEETEALDAIAAASAALRVASSRLERSRKQKALLQRRGGLMLGRKLQSIEDLEALESLEAAGGPVDPEDAKEDPPPKRLRGEPAAAATEAGPSQDVGSPGAGSAAEPPEGSGLVDSARLSPFPDFEFGSFAFDDSLALADLGFAGGTH